MGATFDKQGKGWNWSFQQKWKPSMHGAYTYILIRTPQQQQTSARNEPWQEKCGGNDGNGNEQRGKKIGGKISSFISYMR